MIYYSDQPYAGASAVAVCLRDEVGALAPSYAVRLAAYRDIVARIFALGCRLDTRGVVVVGWTTSVKAALDDLRNDPEAEHLFSD